MKIIGPDTLQKAQPESTHTSKRNDKTTHFDNLLRETIDPKDSTGAAPKGTPLSEPRAAQNIGEQSVSADSLLGRTSRAIDLLETYTKALSDPQKSLRAVEPELLAFVNETRSLYDEYLETDQDDPRLKSVMEDLLRTARLEGIRFQRGDYLDPE
jgi:hypothetical protein